MKTEYTVFTVFEDQREIYSTLEDAIRYWDSLGATEGGIAVQSWRDGLMVRDGYILSVSGGIAYLNPNLEEKK